MAKSKRKRRPVKDWEEWYELASRYYEDHGDLLVPRSYVCPTGEKLGRWIERQRAKYNQVSSAICNLDGVQIDYLNQIGMVWKLETRRDWDIWLRLLDDYAREHGNIDVPRGYACDGAGLGDWLAQQRQAYAAGTLTEYEIEALESRGVNWTLRPRQRSWDDWFADAQDYYRAHGHLMVQLDEQTPDGAKLGYWIYIQRDIYMGRKPGQALTQEQIDRLNGIGMVWEPLASRTDDWERMYGYIAAYWEENQHLPLWSCDVICPDGRSINGWIRSQRQNIAEGKLPADKVERLARLGIVAAKPLPNRADSWERMYGYIAAYREEHQRLPLWASNTRCPDGRSIIRWIRAQRKKLAMGKLPADKVERLAKLGVIPTKSQVG